MSSRTQIQVFGHIVFSFTRDMSEYYFLFFFLCFGAFLANFSLSIISLRAWSSSVSSQAIPGAFSSWRISVLFLVIKKVSLSLVDVLLTWNFG